MTLGRGEDEGEDHVGARRGRCPVGRPGGRDPGRRPATRWRDFEALALARCLRDRAGCPEHVPFTRATRSSSPGAPAAGSSTGDDIIDKLALAMANPVNPQIAAGNSKPILYRWQ
jgi:hypothetical protein